MPAPSRLNPAFGEAVRRVLQEHGLSLRGQRVRTGIGHMTMKDMCDGIVPSLEKLEDFARGFELDINEWRALAGYPRIEDKRSLGTIIRDRAAGRSYHAEEGATAAGYEGGPSPQTQEVLRAAEILLRDEERGIAE